MSLIEVSSISKSYDGKKRVLDNISLNIEAGEFLILVGPSGCGKSTLLRMIAGLEAITDGVLKINGQIANHMLAKDRHLSMVFQNYALYPHMTVRENILFGLDVKKIPKVEQQKRLMETAKMIGLEEYLDRKPGQLSGGQRQRVALARSICSQAPICLMDEPLSNLDAKLRGQMRTEIRRIQKQLGLTVIYVTHDQVEAMTMGDRIVVLNGGHIQQVGTPLELYNAPSNRFVAGFIGAPQMNMAKAVVEGDRLILNNKVSIILNKEDHLYLPDQKAFEIGVRAESIAYSAKRNQYSVPVRVLNTEMMGNETQVVFELGGSTFVAKWMGQWDVQIGTEIFVELNPRYFHSFDKESGNLLKAAELSVEQTFSVVAM